MAADAGETENVLSASIASSGIAESHDNFVKRSTKGTRIEEACRARDLDLLVQLAAQGDGFLTDALRRKACMCTRFISSYLQHVRTRFRTFADSKGSVL